MPAATLRSPSTTRVYLDVGCWMHTGSWVAPSDFSKNQHDLGEKRRPLGGGFSRSVISFGLANSCLNCCNRVLAVAPGVSQDTQVCGSSDSRCAGRTRSW